jgi:Flp pilus assembly protein TadD
LKGPDATKVGRIEGFLTKIDETLPLMIRKVKPMPVVNRAVKLASRTMLSSALVAVVVAASLGPAAQAFPFGRKKAATPAPVAAPQAAVRSALSPAIESPGAGTIPAQPPASGEAPSVPEVPATAEERRAARSLDLVAQSRFWLDELRKRPSDTEAAYEASTSLRAIGSPDRAVQTAAMGIQAAPNEARLWTALSFALVADNQNESALQALQKTILLSPRDARLQSSLGVIYDRLERPDMAATAYQAALALAPGDSMVLSNYGISVAMAGDLPRAETLLRQAVQNPIAPPQARQNLALVVGLQGRFSESEQLASRDLPPAIASENIAYLRRMLNGGDSRWSQAASSNN